jgi:hypothetical protein
MVLRPGDRGDAAKPAGAVPPPAPSNPGAEWYVGIENNPIGPIDLAYMRSQIVAGKVTGQSLVWREDLTDWKPLSSFDELRGLLDAPAAIAPEAKNSDPIALTRTSIALGAAPAFTPAPVGAPAPAPAIARTTPAAPPAHKDVLDAEPPKPAAPVVRLAPAVAAATPPPSSRAPDGADALASTIAMQSPEAEPAPRKRISERPLAAPLAEKLASLPPPPAPEPEDKPWDVAPPDDAAPDSDDLRAAGLPRDYERRRRDRGINPMFWAFIAMAAGFGGVAAWFFFGSKAPADQLAVAPTAGPGGVALAPGMSGQPVVQGDVNAPAGSGAVGEGGAAAQAGGVRNGNGQYPRAGASGSAKVASTDPGAPEPTACTDPDDPFCNSGGVRGPTSNGSGDSGSGKGAGLSPEQANATVSKFRGSLMRKCSSMVTRGSAKVSATIQVSPSGSVSSVSASGGGEFPGLASCVQSRIANWSFPTASGPTTLNVSFNFLSG